MAIYYETNYYYYYYYYVLEVLQGRCTITRIIVNQTREIYGNEKINN